MKAYVTGYRPKVAEVGLETEVSYSTAPVWRIASRQEAEHECQILNAMTIYVGGHRCDFSLEKVAEGEFAIVCLSHPSH